MNEVEIRVVSNGYMARRPISAGGYCPVEETFVFNTFEQLSAWLLKKMSKPKESA